MAAQTSSFESFMQLIGVLLISYLATRWIASYQRGHSFNKNLQVIETLKITANKYIQIVEAGDEYLVIAIGKDEVRLLTKLTREQLKEMPSEQMPSGISSERWKKHIPKK